MKGKKIYCFIFIICLIVSCFCFDDFKTDNFVRPFHAADESNQIYAAGYSILNKDVCTSEMLGNTSISLLRQQTAARNGETQRKSEIPFLGLIDSVSMQSLFKFFSSANPYYLYNNTGAAEIIHFIHKKDGKKRS